MIRTAEGDKPKSFNDVSQSARVKTFLHYDVSRNIFDLNSTNLGKLVAKVTESTLYESD